MSGGHFDYNQYRLNDLADEIEKLIESNDSNEPDGWGGIKGRHYPRHVIDEFKQAVKMLHRARIYVQRIDWLVSGDDGEESFISRLLEELAEVTPTTTKEGS